MTATASLPVSSGFAAFNLPEKMNAALTRMKYETPTDIQVQAIPFALQGRDVLGSARTGTGKTAAFSIPMIVKLMENPNDMALVLAPTRELAAQTLDVIHKITTNNRDMRTALLIGGEGMGKQFDQLRSNPRIIVGTPGRINDHLRRNPKMLARVSFIAVDEADRMLDMGFSEQIDDIFKTIPATRQMLMFSATFPDSIIRFSRKYLNNPERVSVGTAKVDAPKIAHEMKRTNDTDKYMHLLAELEARDGSIIIFVKTQHGTDRLAKRLDKDGHDGVAIHGGLRQNQRDKAVRSFRQKHVRILVATDVAARGLDIPHVEHVINYDLPQVAEDYIHRIGRTARAGASGNAMCFVTPSENGKWNAINRIMNPGAAPERSERSERPNRGGGNNYRGNRSNSGGYNRDKGGTERSRNFRSTESRPRNRAEGEQRPYESRSYDRKPYDKKASNGGQRPFEKREWSKDRPRSDEPHQGRNRPAGNSAGPNTRNSQDKRARTTSFRSSGNRPEGRSGGRSEGPRSKEHRPDWRDQGRGDGRMDNARRADSTAPTKKHRPNKSDVKTGSAARKTFKFKEHSRKPGRSGSDRAQKAV